LDIDLNTTKVAMKHLNSWHFHQMLQSRLFCTGSESSS